MSKVTPIALIGLLFASVTHSAGWTVSHIDSSASFMKLQAAFDAATDGDTIYLDGETNETATLAKRLVLIGQQNSYHPQRSGTALTLFFDCRIQRHEDFQYGLP